MESTRVFELKLSAPDLSVLSEMDFALASLGDLMAEEAGSALPAFEAEAKKAGAPIAEGALLQDPLDELSLLEDENGTEPVDLVPSDSTRLSWAGQTVGTSAGPWISYAPVEGMLPVDDEGGEGDDSVIDEGEGSEEYEGAEPAGMGPIRLRDGVYRIESVPGRSVPLDPELQRLIDKVLAEESKILELV